MSVSHCKTIAISPVIPHPPENKLIPEKDRGVGKEKGASAVVFPRQKQKARQAKKIRAGGLHGFR
jgi:hypothetical protein